MTKGIVARSGTIVIDSSTIWADELTALEAYTGTAVVRAANSEFIGSDSSSAAVSIGPNARLVATNCTAVDSWIGFEIDGGGVDSLINCRAIDNTLTGFRFEGVGPDYMWGNYVTNDSATTSNFGVNVLRQSIASQKDTVKAGYNWNFNFYSALTSNLAANIDELCIVGRDGAQWGLVLNGPSSSNDVAYVDYSKVDSVFTGAHLYIRWISARVAGSQFVSTGNSSTASPIGILDMGGPSTGWVQCSDVIDQKTDLIQRASSSSVNYGDPALAVYGKNSIYVTNPTGLPGTVYFRNLGTSTVKAERNYWGTSDSSKIAARMAGSGPVDFSPFLNSTPLCVSEPPEFKVAAEEPALPLEFALEQNHPNPFNPTTTIGFQLPVEQEVRIDLFNVLGQQVRSFDLGLTPAGYRSVFWNGRDQTGRPVGSGIYFYRLSTPMYTETRKMLLLK